MQSSSFRLISAAISVFLLAVLVTVIIVAIRDNPATALPRVTTTTKSAQVTTAQETTVDAGATAESAKATLAAAPTLSTANIEAVTPTPGGAVEEGSDAPSSVLTGADTENATAEASGAGIEVDSASTHTADDEETPTEEDTSPESKTPSSTTAGVTTEIAGTNIVVPDAATPTPESTPIPPTFDPENGPIIDIYSNGNFVNGVASLRSTLWAATSGGIVAWNKSSGSYVKFTTLDGLTTNQTVAAVVCPLPGLGILFAGPAGIQIFDTQNGSWKSLNSSNSAMHDEDVSTLWCSAEDGLLVVGYTRQGIDLFDAREGTWSYVGPAEGLTVNGIRDIAVVNEGQSIWLAAQDGLALYQHDGLGNGEVEIYTTENSPLVDDRIEAIAADGAGAIWLTNADTLFRIDGEQGGNSDGSSASDADNWQGYDASSGDFPSGRLTGLDVSNNGAIWIGSDQTQLCRFDPGVEGCIGFYREEEGMAAAPLTGLIIDSEGDVYYTTAGGGISVYNGESWRQLFIPDEIAPGNTVRDITQASDNAYWLAGNGGATRYASDSDNTVQNFTPGNSPLPSTNVNVIFPGTAGTWFGTETATFYDGATWTTYGVEEGLTGSSVQAITSDAENRIWLGTNAGLSIWTGSAFFNLTSSNGLPSEDITALQSDGDAIWIGTRGGGLLRFQENQLQLFNRNNSNLPGDTINALDQTTGGDLLIASDQGLARYSGGELSIFPDVAGKSVTALATAPSGEIWIATSLNELLSYNGVEWSPLPTDKLPSPVIDTLHFDHEGALWIGTTQGGMARYTP